MVHTALNEADGAALSQDLPTTDIGLWWQVNGHSSFRDHESSRLWHNWPKITYHTIT